MTDTLNYAIVLTSPYAPAQCYQRQGTNEWSLELITPGGPESVGSFSTAELVEALLRFLGAEYMGGTLVT